MNLNKLNQLIGSMKKDLSGDEQYPTIAIANKVASFAINNPNDSTLRLMSNVLQKMAKDGHVFIDRKSLNTLYKQFYSKNTQADRVLAEELNLTDVGIKNTFASKSFIPTKASKNVLSNLYEGILDKEFSPIFYDKKQAEAAQAVVKQALDSQGLFSKVKVESGNLDLILCLASVETPKGLTNFYVPVEISNDICLSPNSFISHYGRADFKYASAYIQQHCGEQVKVSSEAVFSSLIKKQAKAISNIDLAVAQKKISDAQKSAIEKVKVSIASAEEKTPKHKYSKYVPVEQIAFSKKLATAAGLAEYEFGSDILARAGDLINLSLKSMGHKATNISVSGTDSNVIKFAVKVANASFFVPVKVIDKNVYNPQVLVSNGSIMSFSKNEINKLVSSSLTDSRANIAIANSSNISSNDLMKEFKTSIASNNIDRAEEVLSYLQAKSLPLYKEAVGLLTQALSGKSTVGDECTSYFQSKNSSYPICNHTGLPMNKVGQDKFGKCYALTSKK